LIIQEDFPAAWNHPYEPRVCVGGTIRPREVAVSFERKERLMMAAAFQRAWKTLLVDERVTAENIEFIPTLLMEAIVDAAHAGERDELLLAAAALGRMANHERDELESRLRFAVDRLH
jgi:hypothetical protein